MLTDGFDHVAVMTSDIDAFVEFFREVFEVEVVPCRQELPPGMRMAFVKVGAGSEFNLFQLDGNDESTKSAAMFGRGRLDHLGLRAASMTDFETARERLVARGASDGFVTDFGPVFSCFFVGPEGLEAEVCVRNPDWKPGDVVNAPGTPARRFHPDAD